VLAEIDEIDEIRRAVDARQLAAYAGLTPHERTSGSSAHRPPRLAKTGNSRLRRALYLPAIVAMRHNPAVRALAERLRARGNRPMVIVGAAMRKLLHLIDGVLKSGKPFDPFDPALAMAASACSARLGARAPNNGASPQESNTGALALTFKTVS
jgi:transposase